MTYVTREEVGTQTPQETLNLASGSCRDLATLFIEAVRQLGFGARAVSGYLFDPVILGNPADPGFQHGATHAWAEVYRSEEHTSELQSLMRISYAVFCLKQHTSYQ